MACYQGSKKVLSQSPGQVDFLTGQTLNFYSAVMPNGQEYKHVIF